MHQSHIALPKWQGNHDKLFKGWYYLICLSAERRGEERDRHWPKTIRAQGQRRPRLKAVFHQLSSFCHLVICDVWLVSDKLCHCVCCLVDLLGPVFMALTGACQETGVGKNALKSLLWPLLDNLLAKNKPRDLGCVPSWEVIVTLHSKERGGAINKIISLYIQSKNSTVIQKSYWIWLHGAQVDLEAMGYKSDFSQWPVISVYHEEQLSTTNDNCCFSLWWRTANSWIYLIQFNNQFFTNCEVLVRTRQPADWAAAI